MENPVNLTKVIIFLTAADIAELRTAGRTEGVALSAQVRRIVRAWVEARRAHGSAAL